MVRVREVKANRTGRLRCPICDRPVVQFVSHGNPPRPNILCPICQSKACHRLAWAWFQQHSAIFSTNRKFVHVAPERQLGCWLRRRCKQVGMDYQHGDIRDSKHTLDVLDLALESNSVDVLFACHVLNMVNDDQVAMNEIFRVLSPGGVAILPVPIHQEVAELIEADSDSAMSDRHSLFNDRDMYRKYTAEVYLDRLSSVGFQTDVFRPADVTDLHCTRWTLCDEWVQIGFKPESST
jgi:SAM-dependent methyltransferase